MFWIASDDWKENTPENYSSFDPTDPNISNILLHRIVDEWFERRANNTASANSFCWTRQDFRLRHYQNRSFSFSGLSQYSRLIEARKECAVISIGDGTWINNNFVAIAEHSYINIGRDCLIGANVEIFDSDFHGLNLKDRRRSAFEWAKPVSIGNGVFVGSGVKILKGVSIGDGSVIAHSSVVTSDVPANVVAGGNPARVLRSLS